MSSDEFFDVVIEWGVRVPMRDGVSLSADMYRPARFVREAGLDKSTQGAELIPVTDAAPAIVVRTPYGKSSDAWVQQGRYFASHGYVVIVMDVRGRGDSDGVYLPYRNEGRDGYDTIEWAASQSWCTGSVGTLGGSYLGKIQWLAALEKPPHLKAMIPLVSPSDPFVETPTGTPTPMNVCWYFMTSERMMQNVDAVDWMRVYEHLPIVTMDEQTGRKIPVWKADVEHTKLDDYWREIGYQTRFDEIDLPVMHISGWYDDEEIGTPMNFEGMAVKAPSEKARRGQRLIMGPWPHNVNTSTKVGALDFGPQALIDLRGRQLKFFDYWLKGEQNGEDTAAPVSIFVMGENKWREEQEWPLARTVYTPWYLHSGGRANSLLGDGSLSTATVGATPVMKARVGGSAGAAGLAGAADSDTYLYNPAQPVPFITEETSNQIGGPDDYRSVHRRDDVLVYTSEALTESVEVTGSVKMELYASSSAPDTDFMAQLHDVWPDGTAQRLCDGMVRVRFRNGMDRPELLEPGTVAKFVIDCWHTSHVFLPGHKIRVHIASSSFPKFDRNQNTGEALGQSTRLQVAEQTVYHDASRPSAIILPVIPRN